MKGAGKGACARPVAAIAALLVLLVSAQLADAAVARRLGTGGVPPVSDAALSGPKPTPCTHDPNNPGQKCHNSPGQQQTLTRSSPAVSVDKASNPCTFNPNDPEGKKCHYPPLTAP